MPGCTLSCRLPRKARDHTVLRIPGSHALFVGPSSCMRRHAIGAYETGSTDNVTFLRITQSEVVSGGYEETIVEAVGELLQTLQPTPQIMFVRLFCIDDFLGTDDESLSGLLSSKYPTCRFVCDRIHPVATNEAVTMSELKHFNQYMFIEPVSTDGHDRGVNVLGAFVPLSPKSEIHEVLRKMDAGPLRYLFECETFEEYQAMGKSAIALVTREPAVKGARDMEERLGIPYMGFPACYDVEAVARRYERLADMLGAPLPVGLLARWRRAAADAIEAARQAADGMALAIDCEATLVPHAMAVSLLGYGFDVRWVFRSKHQFDMDVQEREQLAREYPGVVVMRADDPALAESREGLAATSLRESAGKDVSVIAIGDKAARILGTRHVVDIWHDEGLTGYEGICSLMEAIRDQALLAARCGTIDAAMSGLFGACETGDGDALAEESDCSGEDALDGSHAPSSKKLGRNA